MARAALDVLLELLTAYGGSNELGKLELLRRNCQLRSRSESATGGCSWELVLLHQLAGVKIVVAGGVAEETEAAVGPATLRLCLRRSVVEGAQWFGFATRAPVGRPEAVGLRPAVGSVGEQRRRRATDTGLIVLDPLTLNVVGGFEPDCELSLRPCARLWR